MATDNKLMLFEEKQIRHVWHENDWYFSVIDVIEILTESPKPRVYWGVLKNREAQLFTVCKQLKMLASDGRHRITDCANTEGILRLVMSVPSPKAEPFKQWLASLGKQAIEETENPELLTERQAEIYRAKGYSEEWITRRVQTIEIRKALTDEWQQRGVKDNQDYAVLTATIAKGTFGIAPSEHKDIKGLGSQNLRDHMTPLELAFTALSEEITRTVTVRDDAQGFNETMDAAIEGGSIAGEARQNAEKRLGQKVVSPANYLDLMGEKKDVEKLSEGEPTDEI
jgi:DNA-damage-inducible protein D